jgi:preprotein translocase subunit SecG
MQTVVIILHVVASMALILIVLLQTGRGAEMGAAFGGASQTLFGGTGGTTFMSKLTTVAAVVFMLTCMGLTYLSGAPEKKSIMENVPVEKPQGPVLPEAKPVQPIMPGQAVPAPPEAANKGQESAITPQEMASPAQEPAKQESAAPSSPNSQDTKQNKPPPVPPKP